MAFDIFRSKLKKLFQLDCSPRVLALSSALGVFIGFSPYIGFHTALAICLSFVFNLPMYPLLLGAYITNPITMVFIYAACYKLGSLIVGSQEIYIDWKNVTSEELFAAAKSFLVPFFAGTHILGLFFGIFTYFVIYYISIKYQNSIK
jgi:uncharacterized protein (DUF2062 family)